MPRYFMGDTRLAGLERMMMDPSRPAPSRIGPRRQSDDAQRIQAENRKLKVCGAEVCGSTREEPVQRTSAERRRPEEEFPRG